MFAQFRSQYPQGRIQTEMLPKIDGLHAFRAIVSQGDAIMATATAVDSDLEIAEDRAVKRAIAIAGIAFDNNYGGYAGRSPILTQVSREPSTVNSLPSANLNNLENNLENLGSGHHTTHTIQSVQSNPALDYASEYGANYVPEQDLHYTPINSSLENTKVATQHPESHSAPLKVSAPTIAPEPLDMSDAISKIDVEMERLNWTKQQGRDYLVRTFDKKSRQQLTNDELLQFLSHLKSLPTPHRQSANTDDFF